MNGQTDMVKLLSAFEFFFSKWHEERVIKAGLHKSWAHFAVATKSRNLAPNIFDIQCDIWSCRHSDA
jgi:hypothetical protein